MTDKRTDSEITEREESKDTVSVMGEMCEDRYLQNVQSKMKRTSSFEIVRGKVV